jgi:Na+/proline symporter
VHIIDVLIIVAFIVYAIQSGFRSSGVASQNLEEYFLAGRTLPGWKAGLSMAATQFAADTPLLVTGLIATVGIFALWQLWIYALAFLMMGFVLAAGWRRAGVLTDAELTELRYGTAAARWLRGIKAVYLGTVFNCTVLAMVLLAATRIAEPFLHWDQWLPGGLYGVFLDAVTWLDTPITVADRDHPQVWVKSTNNLISIGSIVLVTLFYSTTGGLRSVVATDVFQLFLAMIATAAFAIYVVDKAGGLSGLIATLREKFAASGGPGGMTSDQMLAFTPSRAKEAGFAVLAVFGLQWLLQMNADGTGYLAQRSMACRSGKDAKIAAVVFTVVQVFFRSLFWLPIALGLLVIIPIEDLSLPLETIRAQREATYVTGVEQLPVGLKGLMIAGLLAALASTVDTHLNWGASYWTNDLYKRFYCQAWRKTEPSPRKLVWVARCSNVGILCIALVVMSQLSSIQTAWRASLLLGAGMGVMLVLRWLWWRVNAWGELACIASSLVLAPVLLLATRDDPDGMTDDAIRLLLMAAGATVAGIAASLLTGPEDRDHLRAFYRRVRPQGFWGPVARDEGIDPADGRRQLAWALATVFLAGFSIFSLLVGIGTWLCDSPPPTWFASQGWWIALNVVVGLGLVPVWLHLGFVTVHEPDPPATASETPEPKPD